MKNGGPGGKKKRFDTERIRSRVGATLRLYIYNDFYVTLAY